MPADLWRLATVALVLGAASAQAETPEWRGQLRVTVSGGVDTNPARAYAIATRATPLLLAYLSAEGGWRRDVWSVDASYDGAVRAFSQYFGLSTGAQSGRLGASWGPARWLYVGLGGRAKDRRGGLRDYSDLVASAWVSVVPVPRLELTLEASAHRFIYWPDLAFSFGAPELALSLRWGVAKGHWLQASGEVGERRYRSEALRTPDAAPLGVPRRDFYVSGGGGYRYRGRFTAGLEYRFSAQLSNSFGQTSLRHRIVGTAGVLLPWELTLLAQAAVQLTQFPDQVSLSPELFLLEDEENLNSVSVKVSRTLSSWAEAELRYSFHHAALPTNGLRYLRHTASLGVTFRWGGTR